MRDIYKDHGRFKKQAHILSEWIAEEFEENKIYINEVSEKTMEISGGGSEYNWLSLFNPYLDKDSKEPLYVNKDIETKYKYTYTFEIIHNGKVIPELEFLKV